jgi:hypothetical protein
LTQRLSVLVKAQASALIKVNAMAVKVFTKYRKTHNDGVFDVHTARSAALGAVTSQAARDGRN